MVSQTFRSHPPASLRRHYPDQVLRVEGFQPSSQPGLTELPVQGGVLRVCSHYIAPEGMCQHFREARSGREFGQGATAGRPVMARPSEPPSTGDPAGRSAQGDKAISRPERRRWDRCEACGAAPLCRYKALPMT